MRERIRHARALRQLADEYLQRIVDKGERADLVTSLVRQWLTYDGNATLFLGDDIVYLKLGQTPLGLPVVVPDFGPHEWLRRLLQDWQLGPAEATDLRNQLNRGQGAEVVNGAGLTLQLWVNPNERSMGVVPPDAIVSRPVELRVRRRITVDVLAAQFGDGLNPDDRDELAGSLERQWQLFDGQAGLFLDGGCSHFTIAERADGGCHVQVKQLPFKLEAELAAHGIPPHAFSDFRAQLNRGRGIQFCDRRGDQFRLWYDPKARRICCQPHGAARPTPTAVTPPIFCPACTATLRPWRDGERQLACSLCGRIVAHS